MSLRVSCVLVSMGFLFIILSSVAMAGEKKAEITFGTLLDEMIDLGALARLPDVPFRTIQFSSYDRRSTSPEARSWFSNSDGFGREPIPGFMEVLRKPGKDGVGLYLIADVEGPGAMVRGWSAGMGGILRAYIDGAGQPFFEGPAYDFLARKSEHLMKGAGEDLDCGDAFCQQDGDYLPVPFAGAFRVTWEGRVDALHFYHLEVRLYDRGVPVKSFDPERDFSNYRENLERVVSGLRNPVPFLPGEKIETETLLKPGGAWEWASPVKGPAAISALALKVLSPDPDRALRGTLLRIAFDGAQKAQVESPVGDFFGSAPGLNLFDSPPFTVERDGTMTCRFVMPYRESAAVTLLNSTEQDVKVRAAMTVAPWNWDDRSLYFHAKWRTDNDVDLRSGPLDMPYVLISGQGRFVGCAVMLVNPSACPTPGGNWWGEGDEKIFVDHEPVPSFFGTGTEDYFNYSWSRPDLFDHPYCGQPLDSGPGCLGYVSNHRWHILDSILFQAHFALYIELWPHRAQPGLCYSRIAYLYARPGAVDDHRRIMLNELTVPELPSMEPQAYGGASNSTFHLFGRMDLEIDGGVIAFTGMQPGASLGNLVTWKAGEGDRLTVKVPVKEEGNYSINLVAAHWPESGSIRLLLDGTPLIVDDLGGAGAGKKGSEVLPMASRHARRLLSTRFKATDLHAGPYEISIECIEGGLFGFDYFWIKRNRR